MNTAIAVKALLIKDHKVLLIQRNSEDEHKPSAWDIPGGRLGTEEDPFLGLNREAKEEIGIPIEIIMPVDIQYFTRDDGQTITMIIFLCKLANTSRIRLSEEHTRFIWVPDTQLNEIPSWLHTPLQRITTFHLVK